MSPKTIIAADREHRRRARQPANRGEASTEDQRSPAPAASTRSRVRPGGRTTGARRTAPPRGRSSGPAAAAEPSSAGRVSRAAAPWPGGSRRPRAHRSAPAARRRRRGRQPPPPAPARAARCSTMPASPRPDLGDAPLEADRPALHRADRGLGEEVAVHLDVHQAVVKLAGDGRSQKMHQVKAAGGEGDHRERAIRALASGARSAISAAAAGTSKPATRRSSGWPLLSAAAGRRRARPAGQRQQQGGPVRAQSPEVAPHREVARCRHALHPGHRPGRPP